VEWSAIVGGDDRIPELVAAEWRVVRERSSTPLEDLADGSDERLLDALITLHAIADEACAGLGSVLDAPDDRGCRYRGRARELMVTTGSLARVPPDRLRVLPKARTPRGWGLGRGALVYVCALLTSVDVRSHKLPTRRRGTNRVDHAWALQVDPSAMHNVRREAFEGMRPALLCRSRERGTCSVLRTRISVGLSLSDNEGQGHVDRSEHDRGRAY
jgi:hypothetical protein